MDGHLLKSDLPPKSKFPSYIGQVAQTVFAALMPEVGSSSELTAEGILRTQVELPGFVVLTDHRFGRLVGSAGPG